MTAVNAVTGPTGQAPAMYAAAAMRPAPGTEKPR